MIDLKDLNYLKRIKLSRKHFSWTYYSLLRVNIIAIVTVIGAEFGEDMSIESLFMGIAYLMGILTSVALAIMPFVDIVEFVKDNKMCSSLGWNYELDFLDTFSAKELDKIRGGFKKLTEDNCSNSKIKDELNNLKIEMESK